MEVKVQEPETKKIFKDRKRTNIMWFLESRLISFLVARLPKFVTPNVLTGIGFVGSLMVFLGFYFAGYLQKPTFLLLCILGLAVNWFGDSLDGRLAYYRNIPRKWYGFSLDIIMDWVSIVLIGLGYFFYAPDGYEIVAFVLVVLYGWAMIISQLRYKITDKYIIDAGLVGPTEIRMILALIILSEYFFINTLQYPASVICMILFIINIFDTKQLLKFGDIRDAEERLAKQNKN